MLRRLTAEVSLRCVWTYGDAVKSVDFVVLRSFVVAKLAARSRNDREGGASFQLAGMMYGASAVVTTVRRVVIELF